MVDIKAAAVVELVDINNKVELAVVVAHSASHAVDSDT